MRFISTFSPCSRINRSFRLGNLLGDVVISQGGVVPHIAPELLPTKTGKEAKKIDLPFLLDMMYYGVSLINCLMNY